MAVIAILLFFFVSCKKENSNPADDQDGSSVIFPLNDGNYWIYKHTLFDTTQYITDTWIDTMIISNSRVIDNETWYSIGTGSYLYTNRSDGLYMRDTLDPSIAPQLVLKYPGRQGNFWNNGILDDSTTILSTVNRIVILNNTYTFYKYRTTIDSGYYETIAIPGLGIVNKEFIIINDTGGTRKYGQLEITDYYLH
jgi:hypothetical protein